MKTRSRSLRSLFVIPYMDVRTRDEMLMVNKVIFHIFFYWYSPLVSFSCVSLKMQHKDWEKLLKQIWFVELFKAM